MMTGVPKEHCVMSIGHEHQRLSQGASLVYGDESMAEASAFSVGHKARATGRNGDAICDETGEFVYRTWIKKWSGWRWSQGREQCVLFPRNKTKQQEEITRIEKMKRTKKKDEVQQQDRISREREEEKQKKDEKHKGNQDVKRTSMKIREGRKQSKQRINLI